MSPTHGTDEEGDTSTPYHCISAPGAATFTTQNFTPAYSAKPWSAFNPTRYGSTLYPGGHTWQVWRASLPTALNFLFQYVGQTNSVAGIEKQAETQVETQTEEQIEEQNEGQANEARAEAASPDGLESTASTDEVSSCTHYTEATSNTTRRPQCISILNGTNPLVTA